MPLHHLLRKLQSEVLEKSKENQHVLRSIGDLAELAAMPIDQLRCRRFHRRASARVALCEGILYVRVLQLALHYELEQISKAEILRKLKQRFGGKTIRYTRFRVG